MQATVERQRSGDFSCDFSWSEASRHSESNYSDSEQRATGSVSIKSYQHEPEERDNRVDPPADDSADSDSSDDPENDPRLGNTNWYVGHRVIHETY